MEATPQVQETANDSVENAELLAEIEALRTEMLSYDREGLTQADWQQAKEVSRQLKLKEQQLKLAKLEALAA